jgi:hypothetical protein
MEIATSSPRPRGQHGFDLFHDLHDAPFFRQNVLDQLLRRQVLQGLGKLRRYLARRYVMTAAADRSLMTTGSPVANRSFPEMVCG